jgi:hypothetical protein
VSDDPTQSTPVEPIWGAPAAPPANPVQPTPIAAATEPALEPVRPVLSAPRRSSSGRWLNLLLGVAAAVAIGGVAFAVGRGTAPVAAAGLGRNLGNGGNFVGRSFDPNASFAPGRGTNGGLLGAGGLTIDGTVQSITGDTLTLSTADGRTIDVSLGADTEYHQQAAGSASDVTTGSKVSVQVDLAGRAFGGNGGNGNGNGGQGANGGANGLTGTASDVTVIP